MDNLLPSYISDNSDTGFSEVSAILSKDEISSLSYAMGLAGQSNPDIVSVIRKILNSASVIRRRSVEWHNFIVTFDLDNTIIDFHQSSVSMLGPVKPGFKVVYDVIRQRGYKIGVLTGRPNSDANRISAHLTLNNVPVDFVQFNPVDPVTGWGYSNKPISDLYIDDGSFRFSGDWFKDGTRLLQLMSLLEPLNKI